MKKIETSNVGCRHDDSAPVGHKDSEFFHKCANRPNDVELSHAGCVAKTPEQKYDVRAIALAHQKEPHFLSCSRDGKLIMRRDEKGNFILLAHDQETVVEMSSTDARDFALWVLMANENLLPQLQSAERGS